ncbi:MAG: AraC family transcriptional regulator [Steroidobacteraceae bacterium]
MVTHDCFTGLSNPHAAAPLHAAVENLFPALTDAGRASTLPANSPFGAACAYREVLTGGHGSGFRDYVHFSDDLFGAYSRFKYGHDSVAALDGQGLLKFQFTLAGRNTLKFPDSDDVTLESGTLTIVFHPRGVKKLDCHPQDILEHSVTLACRPGLLTQMLALTPDMFAEPFRPLLDVNEPRTHLVRVPLKQYVARAVEQYLRPACDFRLRHIAAHAMALDLIALALEPFLDRSPLESTHPRLRPRDREALELVRSHLVEKLANPPSVVQLARESGINRTKLQLGFQELFGTTISCFSREVRLQHARTLLRDGLPVSWVAEAVGYQHASSFTAAFRRQFGVCPLSLRKHDQDQERPAKPGFKAGP